MKCVGWIGSNPLDLAGNDQGAAITGMSELFCSAAVICFSSSFLNMHPPPFPFQDPSILSLSIHGKRVLVAEG